MLKCIKSNFYNLYCIYIIPSFLILKTRGIIILFAPERNNLSLFLSLTLCTENRFGSFAANSSQNGTAACVSDAALTALLYAKVCSRGPLYFSRELVFARALLLRNTARRKTTAGRCNYLKSHNCPFLTWQFIICHSPQKDRKKINQPTNNQFIIKSLCVYKNKMMSNRQLIRQDTRLLSWR